MTVHALAHITDLHRLNDEELAQFVRELPGMVAGLRIADRSAQEQGLKLADIFPVVTFDPDLKEDLVLRRDGKEVIRASVAEMVQGEALDRGASASAMAVIQRAREAANPSGPSPSGPPGP